MTEPFQYYPLTLPYPSLWRRFFAVIIDTLILCLPAMGANTFLPYLGGILISFFYFPFFEASALRATPGKWFLDMQVVRETGGQLTLRDAIIRYIAKLLSSMLFCVGHFVALFTDKKQAFHDLLAGSVVIYGKSHEPVVNAWFLEIKKAFHSWGTDSNVSKIERLKALYDSGALTREEFEAEKRKILR